MVPSARRPLRVRHWDGYAQMSKNQKNTSPFADSKGPMPTNPTPIAPLPAIRLHQMLCPTQHAYLRTRMPTAAAVELSEGRILPASDVLVLVHTNDGWQVMPAE